MLGREQVLALVSRRVPARARVQPQGRGRGPQRARAGRGSRPGCPDQSQLCADLHRFILARGDGQQHAGYG